ncbi:MAG: TM0106 family RecB-like putative nuclease [bacterium]|nr:TM0106 family RecB-like putative nuclease [bacterium]
MDITASKLYDYMQCPHRPWRDAWGPQDEKIQETNVFVEMLWKKGIQYEKQVIQKIGDYLDLSGGTFEERFKKTLEAMKNNEPLIYQGVLIADNLRGIPDLLRRMPDGSYMPIDIKSGMGIEGVDEESGDEGKPKKHYAVQLALYSDCLQRLGFENKREGIIYDIDGNEVLYNLDAAQGVKNKVTFWELYEQVKNNTSLLLENKAKNEPAYAGICKLCPWYDSCKKWVIDSDDLSGMFYMGRSWRDIINQDLGITKIEEVLKLDIDDLVEQKKKDKSFLKNLGKSRLENMMSRAKVIKNTKKPVAYNKIEFPKVAFELFFDIEDDPTQEFVYLHGVYERSSKGERFLDFTARELTHEAEKKAWSDFWKYIKSLPKDDYSVYYYSHHEKTTYKKMQKKYPDVVTPEEVVNFFDNPNVIDLYLDVVLKNTDWPLPSYSIKALAVYLGFKWRDETPSGALSIQWFNDYMEKKDEKIMQRILEYNEDDCKATMVLKDGLEKL